MLKTLSGRKPSQDEFEINSLIQFARDHGVKRYLEIGARQGDTFYHVLKSLGKEVSGFAVDLPGGAWGNESSIQKLRSACHALAAEGFIVSCHIGDSHDEATIHKVCQRGPYDLVLIDGDHRYNAAIQDFRDYSPMSKYVAFHDIAGIGQTTRGGDRLPVEVPRVWAELKAKFEHYEFVAPGSKMGIGVLVMPV